MQIKVRTTLYGIGRCGQVGSVGGKLLAAHFADAIDLPTLKRHQDRIRAGLADIEQRLAQHNEHHSSARAFLHDSLRLLNDGHRAYAHSDGGNRRPANQAFSRAWRITDDEQPHAPR